MRTINMILEVAEINGLALGTNIAVIFTAVFAFITLLATALKEYKFTRAIPFRRKLEYQNDFGDYIVNCGKGTMIIKDILIYYDNELVNEDSLVNLYYTKLKEKYGLFPLKCATYLKNSELINRPVGANEELKLVEIDPAANPSLLQKANILRYDLLSDLKKIQNKISIEMIYKTIYGFKKIKVRLK